MALQKQTAQPVRLSERIATLIVGHTTKQIEEILFDVLIYSYIAAWAITNYGFGVGTLITFAVMTPISALFCLGYLWAYDQLRKDWFGFEALKEVREDASQKSGFFRRIFMRILRMGDVPAFCALSIHTDPFMTTLYLRKGAEQYNGLTARDHRWFWSSVFISNAYWTFFWTGGFTFGLWLFGFLPEGVRNELHWLKVWIAQITDWSL